MTLIDIDKKMLEFDLGWKIFLAIMAGETFASQQSKYGLTRNEPKKFYCEVMDVIYNELSEANTAPLDLSADREVIEGIDFQSMKQREYEWYQKNLVPIVQRHAKFRSYYKAGLEAKNQRREQKKEQARDQKAKSLLIYGKMSAEERKRRKKMRAHFREHAREVLNFYLSLIEKGYKDLSDYVKANEAIMGIGYDRGHAIAKFDEAVQFMTQAIELDKKRIGLLRAYRQCDSTKIGEVAAISSRSVLNGLHLNSGWISEMLGDQHFEDALKKEEANEQH